jgi:hypothetical protein
MLLMIRAAHEDPCPAQSESDPISLLSASDSCVCGNAFFVCGLGLGRLRLRMRLPGTALARPRRCAAGAATSCACAAPTCCAAGAATSCACAAPTCCAAASSATASACAAAIFKSCLRFAFSVSWLGQAHTHGFGRNLRWRAGGWAAVGGKLGSGWGWRPDCVLVRGGCEPRTLGFAPDEVLRCPHTTCSFENAPIRESLGKEVVFDFVSCDMSRLTDMSKHRVCKP